MNQIADPILTVDSVCKRFPGVVALDHVSLQLGRGEILSVIGENGAGKSTLMKILAGLQTPDEGQILIDSRPVVIDSVQVAQQNGIALIHQELNLCQNLDVASNIFLGREPTRFGFIDQRKIHDQATELLQRVGLNVSADVLVHSLTLGQQQMVEIAKAFSTNARVVIMDEPTSSLSQRESEKLFELIRQLKSRNVSVIYISHRLAEVQTLSDRVVVLRDGKNAGQLPRDQINHDAMVQRMVGRELSQLFVRKHKSAGKETVLSVKDLQTSANPDCRVSLEIRQGEIVGIAGLVGAGRTELLTTLFGITPAIGGKIEVAGKVVAIRDSQSAIQHGIGLVPEDRKSQGVLLPMSVSENTSLACLKTLSPFGFSNAKRERELAIRMKDQLGTRTPSVAQPVKFLSGGNQQKVVVAKWLATSPRLLMLDEPTRGVDVGAKQEIYRLMDELAGNGVAILFVSSDMEEVLGMSERMIVMHEGRISGRLAREEFSEQAVMNLATGAGELTESI